MSKRLEDFIKNNKEAFDDLEPSASLWGRIELGLPAEISQPNKKDAKVFSLGFVLRVAASIVVIMGISFIFYLRNQNKQTIDLAAINPVYAKQQMQYTSLIEARRTEIREITKTNPQLYKEFNSQIAEMDSTYKEMNNELLTSPNQERVLHAMIHNLQIQMQVLNQQLQVIEQLKKVNESEKDETKNI